MQKDQHAQRNPASAVPVQRQAHGVKLAPKKSPKGNKHNLKNQVKAGAVKKPVTTIPPEPTTDTAPPAKRPGEVKFTTAKLQDARYTVMGQNPGRLPHAGSSFLTATAKAANLIGAENEYSDGALKAMLPEMHIQINDQANELIPPNLHEFGEAAKANGLYLFCGQKSSTLHKNPAEVNEHYRYTCDNIHTVMDAYMKKNDWKFIRPDSFILTGLFPNDMNPQTNDTTVMLLDASSLEGETPVTYFFDAEIQPSHPIADSLERIRNNLSELEKCLDLNQELNHRLADLKLDQTIINQLAKILHDAKFQSTMIEQKIFFYKKIQDSGRRNVFSQLKQYLNFKQDWKVKILFPLNESGVHWHLGEIIMNKKDACVDIQVYCHDPKGFGKMQDIPFQQLVSIFKQQLSPLTVSIANTVSPYRPRQSAGDSTICGVVVIEDMMKRIQGEALPDILYADGAKTLRADHLSLVKTQTANPFFMSSVCLPEWRLFFFDNTNKPPLKFDLESEAELIAILNSMYRECDSQFSKIASKENLLHLREHMHFHYNLDAKLLCAKLRVKIHLAIEGTQTKVMSKFNDGMHHLLIDMNSCQSVYPIEIKSVPTILHLSRSNEGFKSTKTIEKSTNAEAPSQSASLDTQSKLIATNKAPPTSSNVPEAASANDSYTEYSHLRKEQQKPPTVFRFEDFALAFDQHDHSQEIDISELPMLTVDISSAQNYFWNAHEVGKEAIYSGNYAQGSDNNLIKQGIGILATPASTMFGEWNNDSLHGNGIRMSYEQDNKRAGPVSSEYGIMFANRLKTGFMEERLKIGSDQKPLHKNELAALSRIRWVSYKGKVENYERCGLGELIINARTSADSAATPVYLDLRIAAVWSRNKLKEVYKNELIDLELQAFKKLDDYLSDPSNATIIPQLLLIQDVITSLAKSNGSGQNNDLELFKSLSSHKQNHTELVTILSIMKEIRSWQRANDYIIELFYENLTLHGRKTLFDTLQSKFTEQLSRIWRDVMKINYEPRYDLSRDEILQKFREKNIIQKLMSFRDDTRILRTNVSVIRLFNSLLNKIQSSKSAIVSTKRDEFYTSALSILEKIWNHYINAVSQNIISTKQIPKEALDYLTYVFELLISIQTYTLNDKLPLDIKESLQNDTIAFASFLKTIRYTQKHVSKQIQDDFDAQIVKQDATRLAKTSRGSFWQTLLHGLVNHNHKFPITEIVANLNMDDQFDRWMELIKILGVYKAQYSGSPQFSKQYDVLRNRQIVNSVSHLFRLLSIFTEFNMRKSRLVDISTKVKFDAELNCIDDVCISWLEENKPENLKEFIEMRSAAFYSLNEFLTELSGALQFPDTSMLVCKSTLTILPDIKFKGRKLDAYDKMNAQRVVLKAFSKILPHMKDRAATKNKDNYDQGLIKTMQYIVDGNYTIDQLERKADLVERYMTFQLRLDQIDLKTALRMFVEKNPDLNRATLEECYQKYQSKYDELWGMYIEKKLNNVKQITDILDNEAALGHKKISEMSSAERRNSVPIILACISAIFTLQESRLLGKDGSINNQQNSKDEFILKANIIQILGVMRLLAIDLTEDLIPSHVAEILTGQGKSWALALLAACIAYRGQPVVIACYSESLTHRDSASMKEFFRHCKTQDKINYFTYTDLHSELLNLSKANQQKIYYYDMMTALHNNTAVAGIAESTVNDYSNSVMLIDEVDVLFGDLYGQTHSYLSIQTHKLYGDIQKLIWNSVREPNYNEFNLKTEIDKILSSFGDAELIRSELLQQEIKLMISHAISVAKSQDSDRKLYKITANGKLAYLHDDKWATSWYIGYFNAFHYLRLTEHSGYGDPTSGTYGYLSITIGTISYAELPKIFPLRLGVSGSLSNLSESEKRVLADEYSIVKYSYYPNFWGSSNLTPFNPTQNSHYQVFDQEKPWQEAIVTSAQQIRQTRAVLIIFESNEMLMKFHDDYGRSQLQSQYLTGDTSDSEKNEMIYRSSGKRGTVTLLTRVFGRGEDFKCSAEVKHAGGVHMIQTFLSLDIKEEIQIKGRVARQSDPGSYSLFIREEQLNDLFTKATIASLPNKNYETLNILRNSTYDLHHKAKTELSVNAKKRHDSSMKIHRQVVSFFKLPDRMRTGKREEILNLIASNHL